MDGRHVPPERTQAVPSAMMSCSRAVPIARLPESGHSPTGTAAHAKFDDLLRSHGTDVNNLLPLDMTGLATLRPPRSDVINRNGDFPTRPVTPSPSPVRGSCLARTCPNA